MPEDLSETEGHHWFLIWQVRTSAKTTFCTLNFLRTSRGSLPALLTATSSLRGTCHVRHPHCVLGVSPCHSSASKAGCSKLSFASWSCFIFKRSEFAVIQEVTERHSCPRYQVLNGKAWCRHNTIELKLFRCVGLYCRNQSHSLVFLPHLKRKDEPLHLWAFHWSK